MLQLVHKYMDSDRLYFVALPCVAPMVLQLRTKHNRVDSQTFVKYGAPNRGVAGAKTVRDQRPPNKSGLRMVSAGGGAGKCDSGI